MGVKTAQLVEGKGARRRQDLRDGYQVMLISDGGTVIRTAVDGIKRSGADTGRDRDEAREERVQASRVSARTRRASRRRSRPDRPCRRGLARSRRVRLKSDTVVRHHVCLRPPQRPDASWGCDRDSGRRGASCRLGR
jgi:hypothetical protein